jgi:hypothetical protein
MKEKTGRYWNVPRNSKPEEAIRAYYASRGYNSITKGWPDFCFVKYLSNGNWDIQFVEVKRPNEKRIQAHQYKMKQIFGKLGIDVKVAFGCNMDGGPNFKQMFGSVIADLKIENPALQSQLRREVH